MEPMLAEGTVVNDRLVRLAMELVRGKERTITDTGPRPSPLDKSERTRSCSLGHSMFRLATKHVVPRALCRPVVGRTAVRSFAADTVRTPPHARPPHFPSLFSHRPRRTLSRASSSLRRRRRRRASSTS